MRTSGSGNEKLMTVAVIAVAVFAATAVAGGPSQLAMIANDMLRDLAGVFSSAIDALS
jgi:hypothetical protein